MCDTTYRPPKIARNLTKTNPAYLQLFHPISVGILADRDTEASQQRGPRSLKLFSSKNVPFSCGGHIDAIGMRGIPSHVPFCCAPSFLGDTSDVAFGIPCVAGVPDIVSNNNTSGARIQQIVQRINPVDNQRIRRVVRFLPIIQFFSFRELSFCF